MRSFRELRLITGSRAVHLPAAQGAGLGIDSDPIFMETGLHDAA